ncbi:hypothetical protein ASF62_02090 [Leifsonia sp. Leaf325]|nr:GT4 family glycosyltransferase PelF [Leifsonia sp. Leaf325]KQQ95351.1 hypothetical protein ASF62_02090 [Leifsonia sp. Leaf325]
MAYGINPAHRARTERRQALGRLKPTAAGVSVVAAPVEYPEVDIAIVCESTYPYMTGGLSAVVHQIADAHPEFSIGIIHITWDDDSPAIDLYGVPPQVAWIKSVYQSISATPNDFRSLSIGSIGVARSERGALVDRVFGAIDAHFAGDDSELWSLYDAGVNPLTRTFRLWPLLATLQFMRRATTYFAGSGLSFTDLFWKIREFMSLAHSATDAVFPRAGVYHAHTTGAASMLAAAAARQHGGRFLLTEHNLYTRDTINFMLGRSMATVVTADEWRTLDHYEIAATGEQGTVTPEYRAWMAWWTRTGILAYRAAEQITYLYPDAIGEADGIGGIPEKSSVIPNGIEPLHFTEARATYEARQARLAAAGDDRIWKFAYASRVVRIKGLLDLLESLALLVQRGYTNWEIDVMGPDNETPDYAAACRARATELGLDGHVKFIGSVNLRERFGHFDLHILPSHNEGQPIVVLESMTIGIPTVGTYVGGMKQLVEDVLPGTDEDGQPIAVGAGGLLVRSHDVVGIADSLERIMTTEGLAAELSANGRTRAESIFHIDTAMGMYRSVYGELLGTTAAAPAATSRSATRRVTLELASTGSVSAISL